MGNANRGQTPNPLIESNPSTSSNNPLRRSLFLSDQRIDQFILIWLDRSAHENSLHSLHTRAVLKQINNDHCLFFDQIDLFLSTIVELKNENKNSLVIISGSFAKEILPKIKDLSTLIIFCRDSTKYIDLVNEYDNVIEICTEYETLKNCIKCELPTLKFNLFSNRKFNSLRILTSSEDIGQSGAYFSYMLFIDLLKRMPQTPQAKENMLNKLKDYYRGNSPMLEHIELFRTTYTSDTAIDWYTKDSFVYRLVNQAFRTEDVALWYLFRFYIIDLCTQLENVHREQTPQSSFIVYRGQTCLPIKELESLQSNIGGLTSTNGFFSTSTNSEVAKIFISSAKDTEDSKVAFFQITVDACHLENISFVNIDKYTGDIFESEVLFNIGSVFKIDSVYYESDLSAWKIEMTATDQGTQSIKDRIDTTRKKFRNCNINLLFGRLLLDTSQYTKAKSYFEMMLQFLPQSHEDLTSVYDHIGDLNMQTTNWQEALKYFHLAYEIKKKKRSSNHPDIGVSLTSIGNYYKAIGDHVQALEHYQKALQCKNNQFNTAIVLVNISTIHKINKNFTQALKFCYEARDIFEEIHPRPYAAITNCQGILADIYFAQGKYKIAEDFYTTALEMCKRHLFIDDHRRVICIKALANFYDQQNLNQQTIDLCHEHLSFHEQYLGENHTSIAHLLIRIAELYEDNDEQRIKSLKRALVILQENVSLEYATTANCLMMIAEYHQKQNDIDMALTYYIQAIDIRKKIYPKNHSLVIQHAH